MKLVIGALLLLGLSFGKLAAAPTGAPEVENGYLRLGFDRLASYKFTPPPYDPATAGAPKTDSSSAAPKAAPEDQIPAGVKAWNGKKAIVTGFMLPVKMDNGLVTEFLLVKDAMMCCYGTVPNMNEWVVVRMNKGGVRPLMDMPISFYGELNIGAMYENGYMTGIYLLKGEKMADAKG